MTPTRIAAVAEISKPQKWVLEMVGTPSLEALKAPEGIHLERRVGDKFTLVSAHLEGSRLLTGESLSGQVEQAHEAILEALEGRFPVRFWNFIPGILEPLGELKHRYMAFNAGRLSAFARAWGDVEALPEKVPCASGLGVSGDHLLINALAGAHPGRPTENPRQLASYRYSKVHGPLPPCFARATVLEAESEMPPRLLVAGTASICGEETLHQGILQEQLRETFLNLASVVHAALGQDRPAVDLESALPDMWKRYRQLRVYYPNESDREVIESRVRDTFSDVRDLTLHQADLCRDHLLVEIEGWADLSRGSEASPSKTPSPKGSE